MMQVVCNMCVTAPNLGLIFLEVNRCSARLTTEGLPAVNAFLQHKSAKNSTIVLNCFDVFWSLHSLLIVERLYGKVQQCPTISELPAWK